MKNIVKFPVTSRIREDGGQRYSRLATHFLQNHPPFISSPLGMLYKASGQVHGSNNSLAFATTLSRCQGNGPFDLAEPTRTEFNELVRVQEISSIYLNKTVKEKSKPCNDINIHRICNKSKSKYGTLLILFSLFMYHS